MHNLNRGVLDLVRKEDWIFLVDNGQVARNCIFLASVWKIRAFVLVSLSSDTKHLHLTILALIKTTTTTKDIALWDVNFEEQFY